MKVGVAYCNEKNAFLSGKRLAEEAMRSCNISRPNLVFAFCNAQVSHEEYFQGLRSVVGEGTPIVGGSAIGVITNDSLSYEGCPAAAAVIQSERLAFKIATAENLDKDEKQAGLKLAKGFSHKEGKVLLIFYDSIRVPPTGDMPPVLNASSSLIEGIEEGLQSSISILGAGVIGDYAFSLTHQFCGFHIGSQSVVGIMLSGAFTPYFRIMHGCTPLNGFYHGITRMEGSNIYELDGRPIVEIIDELYGNQGWHHEHPVNLLTIGINHGKRFEEPKESNYVNRLITGILPNGEGIGIFEPDLEPGMEIQFMLRDSAKMLESARKNSAELMEQVKAEGKRPLFGLYIDCAGRAASYLNSLTEEAKEVQEVFNRYQTPLLGFYSGVEIAPLLGKSRGLDWTGVLIVLAGD